MSTVKSEGQVGEQTPAAFLASTGFLLALIGAEARRLFARALAAHDLTLAQYGALMTLSELGPISQQRLGQAIGVDSRNLVSVVDALEGRGILRREPDLSDRRRHRLVLTSAGRTLLVDLRGAGEALESQFLNGLTDRERQALHTIAAKLYLRMTGAGKR